MLSSVSIPQRCRTEIYRHRAGTYVFKGRLCNAVHSKGSSRIREADAITVHAWPTHFHVCGILGENFCTLTKIKIKKGSVL